VKLYESIELIIGPALGEEGRTQDDDSELRGCQATVNLTTEAVTQLKRELVVPHIKVGFAERMSKRADKAGLILASMRDECVVTEHALYFIVSGLMNVEMSEVGTHGSASRRASSASDDFLGSGGE
jgi:hypothetical protein